MSEKKYTQGTLKKLCGIKQDAAAIGDFLIRPDGLWFKPPPGFSLLTVEEQEVLSGFQELEPIETTDGEVYGLSTLEGAKPLLPFPFTPHQLWMFNYSAGDEISARLGMGDDIEQWISEQSIQVQELVKVLLADKAPCADSEVPCTTSHCITDAATNASISQEIADTVVERLGGILSLNPHESEMRQLLRSQLDVMSRQARALEIQAKTSNFASMKLDLAQHVNVQISVQQTKADDLHPDYAMKPSLVPTSKAVSPEQGCNPASAESGLDRNTENSAHTPEPIEHQNWIVVSPKRFSPYKLALQKFLQAEWQKGRLRIPTPRDVLEAWSVTKPPEIFEVMLDAFKYLNAEGEVKEVSLSALKSAIARATKVNNETARAR